MLKRNQDLSPNAQEQTAIANLVTKVQGVLDNLVVAPGEFSTCVSEYLNILSKFYTLGLDEEKPKDKSFVNVFGKWG